VLLGVTLQAVGFFYANATAHEVSQCRNYTSLSPPLIRRLMVTYLSWEGDITLHIINYVTYVGFMVDTKVGPTLHFVAEMNLFFMTKRKLKKTSFDLTVFC